MIFGKSKLELKVGIFVFVALIILVIFVLLIGDIRTMTSGYRINFIFNFTNGVKIGAPIRYAGVDVGEVKDIEFFYAPDEQKTKVKLMGWVKRDVRMPVDSEVWINTLGLLGEKYVEVMPGKDYAQLLPVEGTFVGKDPLAMHEIGEMAKNLITGLDESFSRLNNKEGTIGKLLYDDAIYKELEIMAKEFEALATDLRKHPWKLLWKPKEKPKKR